MLEGNSISWMITIHFLSRSRSSLSLSLFLLMPRYTPVTPVHRRAVSTRVAADSGLTISRTNCRDCGRILSLTQLALDRCEHEAECVGSAYDIAMADATIHQGMMEATTYVAPHACGFCGIRCSSTAVTERGPPGRRVTLSLAPASASTSPRERIHFCGMRHMLLHMIYVGHMLARRGEEEAEAEEAEAEEAEVIAAPVEDSEQDAAPAPGPDPENDCESTTTTTTS
jgi:hypothetical protein